MLCLARIAVKWTHTGIMKLEDELAHLRIGTEGPSLILAHTGLIELIIFSWMLVYLTFAGSAN